LEESLRIRRSLGDESAVAQCLLNLGFLSMFRGDLERAGSLHAEGHETARRCGDLHVAAACATGIGVVARLRGDFPAFLDAEREAMATAESIGDRLIMVDCLAAFADYAATRGDPLLAARLFGAHAALRATIDVPPMPLLEAHFERGRAPLRAQLGGAYETAFAEGGKLTLDEARVLARSVVPEPVTGAP
jgi:hypothetical protein